MPDARDLHRGILLAEEPPQAGCPALSDAAGFVLAWRGPGEVDHVFSDDVIGLRMG